MIDSKLYKRIYTCSIILVIVFSLLVGKLFFIQLIQGKKYAEMAKEQRERRFRIYPTRGIIYDRNLIPLTNNKREKIMFVFNPSLEKSIETIKYIKKYTNLEAGEIEKLLSKDETILEIPVTKNVEIIDKNIRGIVVADKTYRYNDENLLTHVIGYNNGDNSYGIESNDDTLKAMDKRDGLIAFTVDSKEKVIPGIQGVPVINDRSIKPNNIRLTIDYHIQKIAEKSLDKRNYNGAIIVNEVATGDIVAMASRPNFDPYNIKDYIDGEDGELINRAIQYHYSPGSIFKIVVLLSALENNLIDLNEKFTCDGSIDIYGKTFHCHEKDGHGEIDIKEAFAKSCNSVFIEIGERLGGKSITETAKKLGFSQKHLTELSEEISGSLPSGNNLLGPAIGNISLGQGDIEVTPIQVANMMTIIANGGIMKDLSIIKDAAITNEGYTVKPYNKEKDIRKISSKNSSIINDFLKEVFKTGTGKNFNLENIGGAAGKTGSAQWGVNNSRVNGWFSGYFPKDNPKYVITIVIEDGGYSSSSALPVFEDIINSIWNIGRIKD